MNPIRASAVALLAAPLTAAFGTGLPSNRSRLVPSSPGRPRYRGALVSPKLAEVLVSLRVENRVASGGIVAARQLAKAPRRYAI